MIILKRNVSPVVNMVRINLITNPPEQQVFSIDDKLAQQSAILRFMIEKCAKKGTDTLTIPVKVSAPVLEKILHWAEYRRHDPETSVVQKRLQDLCRWDIEFFEENHGMLIELIRAVELLKFEQLYCDASVFISDVMRRKPHKDAQEYLKLGPFSEKNLSALPNISS